VRIVTPKREDRRPYAFVEFEKVQSAVAAIEELQFRVRMAHKGFGRGLILSMNSLV